MGIIDDGVYGGYANLVGLAVLIIIVWVIVAVIVGVILGKITKNRDKRG